MKTKITLLLSLVLILIQCQKMNNKYEWLILTTADEGYPMEIKSGAFYDENGEDIAGIPGDMYLSSQWWNGDSGVMIVGDEFRSIPASMSIKWFSYAEDKFYKGTFKLDYEKLKSIFKKGLGCGKVKINSRYFKVSIAPKGQVFLYLISPNTELVGNFQATEYSVIDFKEEMHIQKHIEITRDSLLKLNIKNMPLQTQKEIANKKISTEIWKDINLKYPWKYSLEAEEFEHLTLTMQEEKKGVEYINGENAWCIDGTDYFLNPKPKPIPLEIDGSFKTSAGRTFTIRIYPGNVGGLEADKQEYAVRRAREQELVKLFKDFYEKIGKQDFDIHLRMDESFRTGKVFLKKGYVEQEIPNTEVQIFDETFDK